METETYQHYQILRRGDGSLWELGRGSMAVTYKAFDVNLCCPVALKVVNAHHLEEEHTRARFVREARAAAALRHRNIASVYHLGNDEQSYFYAMEFVDGETIEDLVRRRGPLPPAEALGIAAQVARALRAAAREGLVHRDIKPANLMVVREEEDEGLLVKVIDFGLARRAVVADAAAQITLSGFVGTPQYASPEQIEERDLDSRSDIYSLGVTLWYMLTGQPTFTGPVVRISALHLHGEPPWTQVAHLPAPVRAVLARTLQKNPADRPQDPVALRHEIEACLAELARHDPTAAAPTTAGADPGDASGTTVRPDTVNDEAATAAPPEPPDAAPTGPAPAAGEVLAGRFTLLEAVGEGGEGQVFRATDAVQGDRPVAVKILRPDLGLGRMEFDHLKGDLRRLRSAPHPRLIEVFALDQARGYRFVASEWVNGFILVDLLRHRGRLELLEAFHLLAHASDAAAHGSANALHRLELTPRQIFVHFPAAFDGDRNRAVRAILDRPLARWPEFGLKIDALAPARETGRTPTWAGARTLVPAAREPGRDTQSSIRGLLEGSYFYALGSLLYEMLGATLPPSGEDTARDLPPLPALNEEANGLLERALSANPGFRDEREFFDALLAASGLTRGELRFTPPPGTRGQVADATVVPPADRVASGASTVSPASAVPASFAPAIPTKLLRPRVPVSTPVAVDSRPRLHLRPAVIVAGIIVATVLLLAAGLLIFLSRRQAAPPLPAPVVSPTEEDASPEPSG